LHIIYAGTKGTIQQTNTISILTTQLCVTFQ